MYSEYDTDTRQQRNWKTATSFLPDCLWCGAVALLLCFSGTLCMGVLPVLLSSYLIVVRLLLLLL
jgi:hypothetical protein